MRVERYTDQQHTTWDEFIGRSKNATFQFYRDYMDYHRDRFSDHSLMIYDQTDRLVALMPAHVVDSTLVSHSGLSFGGFLTDAAMKTPLMLDVFMAALSFCRNHRLTAVRYKAIPSIYHRIPAQEDLYALHLCGGQLIDRSVTAVIGLRERIVLPKGRRYSVNKARKHGLNVCDLDEDLRGYWALLEATLHDRHQAHPVHSVEEMERLQARFPQNIQLYTCRDRGELLAGVVIYESACVARTQYIAASQRGRELSALDLIFDHLLNQVFPQKPFFDFGTSVDPRSGKMNGGLLEQKESFGGRAVMRDLYLIDLEQCNLERLEQAIIP